MTWLGIILAAGASRRIGRPKALYRIDGETLVARSERALRGGGVRECLIVLGPPHGARIAVETRAEVLLNPEPERGMLSSAALAAQAALARRELTGAVLALIDHPHARASTIQTLIAHAALGSAWVVRPASGGRRGHPIVLTRPALAAVAAAPSHRRLCDVLRDLPGLDVPIADPAVLEDLDTPGELARAGALP
ncbi:MAG: NTP transferase domain-containing protein [Polyangiaceae bacterium]|nr:NTP transferase domain-containing protein [Polyangiaceae bacterium]